jgi:hypothetical protein
MEKEGTEANQVRQNARISLDRILMESHTSLDGDVEFACCSALRWGSQPRQGKRCGCHELGATGFLTIYEFSLNPKPMVVDLGVPCEVPTSTAPGQ